jgi:SHS2 domain-containing protein
VLEEAPRKTRQVRVDAPDRGALLVRWLDELVFLAETDGFIPEARGRSTTSRTTLRAPASRAGSPSSSRSG